jgi:DNA-binding IclR family transcriptional regulator
MIRELGFASDLGEFAKGITAVAAPVFGPRGQVIGVLLLFGTFPEYKVEKCGRRVATTAKQITERLGN